MTKKSFIISLVLCLALTEGARAYNWQGSGTEEDPYLLSHSGDWAELAIYVNEGESFSGKHFRMTADFSCGGYMVGDMTGSTVYPFSGTFDGDGRKCTVCLPYTMPVPADARVYCLTGRNGDDLVMREETETGEVSDDPATGPASARGSKVTLQE